MTEQHTARHDEFQNGWLDRTGGHSSNDYHEELSASVKRSSARK
jgi:hypothetical protein